MVDPGLPESERLQRLHDLSDQISAAMTEMLAFQARVTAALLQIERARAARARESAESAPPSARSARGGTRKRPPRAA